MYTKKYKTELREIKDLYKDILCLYNGRYTIVKIQYSPNDI